MGHPLIGDTLYGGASISDTVPLLDRPALHAAELGFTHPITQERMMWKAPLPADLRRVLQEFGDNEEQLQQQQKGRGEGADE